MEFIPLEAPQKGKKKSKAVKKGQEALVSPKKMEKNKETKLKTKTVLEEKSKGKLKMIPLKRVKNQYKEKILEKREKKSIIKKNKKALVKKREDMDSEENEENFQMEVKQEEDKEQSDESEDEAAEDCGEEEGEKKKKIKREKWRQMDEKKKNRLFIKLKKKIHSESQIKELHPDIKGVIFPRKKNSRWCWAVFVSEESAHKAFLELVKNKDVLVSKPNTREQIEVKREKKMATVTRKEQAKRKLLNMWT